jgi:hypothetical protein
MTMIRVLLGILLLSSAASGQILLDLRVEPAELAPALRPTLRIEARNIGGAPARVPVRAALQVMRDGRPFIAALSSRSDSFVLVLDQQSILSPGEVLDLTLWESPGMPWWSSDARLYPPGTYDLQLVLDDALDSERLAALDRVLDHPGLRASIVSNRARLVVAEPQGDAAVVWEMIRELPEPTFWTASLTEAIWEKAPESDYAVWAVPQREDRLETMALRQAVIDRDPDSLAADWQRLFIAQVEGSRAYRLALQGDLKEASAASDRAKKLLERLMNDARDPRVRQEALERMRVDVSTREELEELHRLATGTAVPRLEALAECVTGTGTDRIVWFGYQNTGKDPITIPLGQENRFTPPPHDRGQPTVFKMGVNHLAFGMRSNEPQLIWHLRGQIVKAESDSLVACPDDDW